MKVLKIIASVGVAFLLGCVVPSSAGSEFYLLVGTYTSGDSDGIYVYKFDSDEGSLNMVGEATGVENPSYLAVSPDHRFVYSVNENATDSTAAVSAFAFDKTDGKLKFINSQSSGGGAPCFISMDQTGSMVFTGNYLGGSLAMLPVNEDGSLKQAEIVIQHNGKSINERRQESPHVHCTLISPDNNYLLVADLGTDHVASYAVDANYGKMESNPSFIYEAEPGAGPRHLTFHPNGMFAYLINELNGSIVSFRYEEGTLDPIQTISTLPKGYKGRISGADIQISPDGKFLYASNREDLNSIVIYAINQETGKLSYTGHQASGGEHPRNFMIDPTGKFLLVANRNTNNVVVFSRDAKTGHLTPTGVEAELSMPVFLTMVPGN